MSATWKQMAIILGLSILAAALSALFHPKRPAWYRVISPEQARWHLTLEEAVVLLKETSPLWVDARSLPEHEGGHVEGSIMLNTSAWGDLMFKHMDTLQDAMNQSVIVYGEGIDDLRTEEVARRLRELLGLEPVYVLRADWRSLPRTDLEPALDP